MSMLSEPVSLILFFAMLVSFGRRNHVHPRTHVCERLRVSMGQHGISMQCLGILTRSLDGHTSKSSSHCQCY
ncbi:hypothetical protein C8Q78DRAFT_1035237 [Trametes maxima]|nr:hypothetical protein C8Q78DRAFT_1035237 [Trametes maxima]